MKKLALIIVIICFSLTKIHGQIYVEDSCRISFFSSATIENIAAYNKGATLLMNTSTNDIQISIKNNGFTFKKKLMQEHYNEDYMETDKYPNTIFKGKVNEKVNYSKDGENKVTVTGNMEMHGVTKSITISGTITIKNGVIFLKANFDAKLVDYNIKIPKMLGGNIAEQVAISLSAKMKPYKSSK